MLPARIHPRRAYTLIELLLIVAILGIAASLLIPQMVGRDIMSAQAAVRLIIGDLSFAQSDALAHQELRRVHFYDLDGNGNGRGYCITRITDAQLAVPFDDDTADYINDPLASNVDDSRYIVDFTADDRFEGVTITEVNIDGGGQNLQFDQIGGTVRSGGLPGTGGTIVVTSDDVSYRITIAPFTGKLTVEEL